MPSEKPTFCVAPPSSLGAAAAFGAGGASASPALAAAVDAAVSDLLRAADAWAAACCAANVPLLTEIGEQLLAEETLSGPTLDALLARAALPHGFDAWIETGAGVPDAQAAPAGANGRH